LREESFFSGIERAIDPANAYGHFVRSGFGGGRWQAGDGVGQEGSAGESLLVDILAGRRKVSGDPFDFVAFQFAQGTVGECREDADGQKSFLFLFAE
jgi:hypothetical protein